MGRKYKEILIFPIVTAFSTTCSGLYRVMSDGAILRPARTLFVPEKEDSMKTLTLSLVSALVMGLTACGGGEPALVFSGDVTQEWEAARANGDADAIAALHTEDAQVMPPNAPMVEGRSAIRAYY